MRHSGNEPKRRTSRAGITVSAKPHVNPTTAAACGSAINAPAPRSEPAGNRLGAAGLVAGTEDQYEVAADPATSINE